jgi:hypothetical protein
MQSTYHSPVVWRPAAKGSSWKCTVQGPLPNPLSTNTFAVCTLNLNAITSNAVHFRDGTAWLAGNSVRGRRNCTVGEWGKLFSPLLFFSLKASCEEPAGPHSLLSLFWVIILSREAAWFAKAQNDIGAYMYNYENYHFRKKESLSFLPTISYDL